MNTIVTYRADIFKYSAREHNILLAEQCKSILKWNESSQQTPSRYMTQITQC